MQFDGIFLFFICLPYFKSLAVFLFPLTVGAITFHICAELSSWKHTNSLPFISQMHLPAEFIFLTGKEKNIHSIYFGNSSMCSLPQYIYFLIMNLLIPYYGRPTLLSMANSYYLKNDRRNVFLSCFMGGAEFFP